MGLREQYRRREEFENPADKVDEMSNRELARINRRLARNNRMRSAMSLSGRVFRSGMKGLTRTRDSLKTPSSKRRPKIAQLPATRRDIPIADVGRLNLDGLKDPNLRGQSIMGLDGRKRK